MNTVHAQLPQVRTGKEYVATFSDLLGQAKAASKTDTDLDYREDFVQTKTTDCAPLAAQLSAKLVSTSKSQWDDYDNCRTDRTTYRELENRLEVVEHSVVDRDNCDYEVPWTRVEGVARTLTIDLGSLEIVGDQHSQFDPKSKLWS